MAERFKNDKMYTLRLCYLDQSSFHYVGSQSFKGIPSLGFEKEVQRGRGCVTRTSSSPSQNYLTPTIISTRRKIILLFYYWAHNVHIFNLKLLPSLCKQRQPGGQQDSLLQQVIILSRGQFNSFSNTKNQYYWAMKQQVESFQPA